MSIFRFLVLVCTLTITGCANFYPPSSKSEIDAGHSYWVSHDASRRGTIIVSSTNDVKTCSEPSPDVALTFINSLKGGVELPDNVSVTELDATLKANAMALAGRDNLVLLARESLFRICEASVNGAIEPTDVAPLFKEVFEQVRLIAEAQSEKAKNNAAEEDAKLQQLKIRIGQ